MKFSEYNFKPSDVIEGLNAFYKKDEENKNSACPPFGWRIGASKYACHFFNIKTRDGKSYETFGNEHLEEAITWLRDEHDIFYTPGMTFNKEDEALEALRDIYSELDCPGEASFRRWHNLDIDDVSIEHMKDYIKSKAEFYKDLSEKTNEDNQTLRDLINKIHEESDI